MTYCTTCGAPVQPEAAYCPSCGAAVPRDGVQGGAAVPAGPGPIPVSLSGPRPGRQWWPWALGAAVLAAFAVLAVALLHRGSAPAATSATTGVPTVTVTATQPSSASTSSASSTTASASTSVTTSATPTLSAAQQGALDELRQLRAASLPGLQLDGHWALQLSSKRNGTVDTSQRATNGTHTFFYADILALHKDFVDYVPDGTIRLLRASDFGKQNLPDPSSWWVTVADPGYLTTEAEARSYCESHFLDEEMTTAELENMCLPRRLTAPH